MKCDLIKIYKGLPKASSWELSKCFNINHRVIKRAIKSWVVKNQISPEEIVNHRLMTHRRGGQIDEYLITKEQVILIAIFIESNEKTAVFKKSCLSACELSDVEFFTQLEKIAHWSKENSPLSNKRTL